MAPKKSNRQASTLSIDSPREETVPTKAKRHPSSSNSQQTKLTSFTNEKTDSDSRNGTNIMNEEEEEDMHGIREQLVSINKNVNAQTERLKIKIEGIETNLINKFTEQFEKLRSEVFSLQKENDFLKSKLKKTDNKIQDLEEEVSSMRQLITLEREKRNELEQYQRRDSVRFLGIGPDRGNETVTDCETKILSIIKDKLGIQSIQPADISIAHRVGPRGLRPRPIIVKFVSRKLKNEVLYKRRSLKGSGIGIVEDLSPTNMSRLTAVKQHINVKDCWTKEGRIFALLRNDRIVQLIHGDMAILGSEARDQRAAAAERSHHAVRSDDRDDRQPSSRAEARQISNTSRMVPSTPFRRRRAADDREASNSEHRLQTPETRRNLASEPGDTEDLHDKRHQDRQQRERSVSTSQEDRSVSRTRRGRSPPSPSKSRGSSNSSLLRTPVSPTPIIS